MISTQAWQARPPRRSPRLQRRRCPSCSPALSVRRRCGEVLKHFVFTSPAVARVTPSPPALTVVPSSAPACSIVNTLQPQNTAPLPRSVLFTVGLHSLPPPVSSTTWSSASSSSRWAPTRSSGGRAGRWGSRYWRLLLMLGFRESNNNCQ